MKKKLVYGILIGAMCCSLVGCGAVENTTEESVTEATASLQDANADIANTLIDNSANAQEEEQKKKEEQERKEKEKLIKELFDNNLGFDVHSNETLYGKTYMDVCVLRNYDVESKTGNQDVMIKYYDVAVNNSMLHATGETLSGGYWHSAPEYWVLREDKNKDEDETIIDETNTLVGPMTYIKPYDGWTQYPNEDKTYDITKFKDLKYEYFIDLDVTEDKDGNYMVTGKLKPMYLDDFLVSDSSDFLYVETSRITKPISMRIAFNKYTKECVYLMYFLSDSLDYLEEEGTKVEGYNVLVNFDKYDYSSLYLPNELLPKEETEEEETTEENPDEVVIIDGQEQTKVPTNTKKTPEPQPEKQTTEELTTEELTTEELPPTEPNTETPTQEESTTQEENPTPNEQGE